MTAQLTHLRAQHHIKDLQRKADAAAVGRRRWGAASFVTPGPAHRAFQRGDGVMAMLDVRAFRAGSVLGFGALRRAAATGPGANRIGMRAVVGRPGGPAPSTVRRVTRAALAGMLATLLALLLSASAGAYNSPYVKTGTIAAYDAAGNPVVASYYDRIGGGTTALIGGDSLHTFLQWGFLQSGPGIGPDVGPDGGPFPASGFTAFNVSCSMHEAFPYTTGANFQEDTCWDVNFDPTDSTPGTYGILMPPSVVVGGVTQVFDHWNVTNAITTGKCRTGDMGIGVVDGDLGGPTNSGNPGSPPSFPSGPEYRIWTDLNHNLGMGATIEAHYAAVSPDTTAPLVTIAPAIDCASVEQHSSTLVADFKCQEPDGLGSGVASCIGRDDGVEVANGDPLDTSTVGNHNFTVTAVDNAGNQRSRTMQYTVVDSPPTALALSNNVLDDHQPAGTTVGTFSTTDPGPDAPFTYELVGGDGSADNASFTIDGDTLKTATSLDYKIQSSYAIRVRTTDADGASLEQTFTVALTPVIYLSNASVAEHQPAGTVVGTLTGPGNDNSLPFGILYGLVAGAGDTGNASFVLDSGGQLSTAAPLDYATQRSYSIRVAACGTPVCPNGQYGARTLTISVTDVDPPTDISLSNASVAQNQPAGTSVGSLSTTDQDGPDTYTYSLVDGDGSTDNASFSIDGSTLSTAASFDSQAKGSYSIRVRSTDSSGNSTERVFNITVQDTTPPKLSLPGDVTAQATGPNGAVVSYSATATDVVDGSRPVTCTPASGSSFPIGATTVHCSATDAHGNTANGTFTVHVTAPTVTSLSSSPNPALATQQVTLTATVSPAPDGGTVAFDNGNATIAGCGSVSVNTTTGLASCQTSALPVGGDQISAVYSGDPNYLGSTSSALTEKVIADTPQNLGNLTLQDVESSAKFQALPRAAQKLIDALANQAIAQLANITPHLNAAQLAKLVTAYKQGVAGLQSQGYLTAAQASTLDGLADHIQP